ncbi:3-isopropylmalate dehydratase small subunit [Aquibium carbonis]|uniref:3-isopropylmalate dehydratase small subunit n=1 Tax=Aquibium carbonis TaxID=2495581 RepID=A0A429Z0X4_9HYPH|nr:3-isopropylmalate dehydratase small subunit [Aquibium carbonis]RST87268.1 3-isopropylmalate dehydratase small subunit [Aquibium carbonis]
MEKFTTLTSVAAPLPETHLDTDVIFPARFLLLPDKKGLGEQLFNERRVNRDGDGPRFVLDTPPWNEARILVTGRAFGTGSSREQAVWALADFGFRCVIAPSFGEIFFSNCFKNGVLPIVLGEAEHADVMAKAEQALPLTIDLEAQEIRFSDGRAIAFDIDPHRKRTLIEGLDEIGLILADDQADIAAFEARQREQNPWLHLTREQLTFFDDVGEELR